MKIIVVPLWAVCVMVVAFAMAVVCAVAFFLSPCVELMCVALLFCALYTMVLLFGKETVGDGI